MSWNRIRGKAAVALANSIRANPKLQILHCGWNGLADIGAKAFAEALKVNSSLTYIDITNNRISIDGGVALGKAIEVNRGLETIKIGSNQIGGNGISAFLHAASINSNVKEMDFSSVNIPADVRKRSIEITAPSENYQKAMEYETTVRKQFQAIQQENNMIKERIAAVEQTKQLLADSDTVTDKIVSGVLLEVCEDRLAKATVSCKDSVSKDAYHNKLSVYKTVDVLVNRGGPAAQAARDAVVETLVNNPKEGKLAARKAKEAYRKANGTPSQESIYVLDAGGL